MIKNFELGFEIPMEKFSSYLSFIESKVKEWYKYTLDYVGVDENKLTFRVKYGESIVEAKLFGDVYPRLEISYDSSLPYEYILNIALNIYYFTSEFYSVARDGTLILVFVPGLPVIPTRTLSLSKKILYGIFTGSLASLFALSLIIGVFFFLFMGVYAPIGIASFQALLFILSPKILSFMGDWSISKEHGDVYIISCSFPLSLFNELTSKRWGDILSIKEKLYNETFNLGVIPTPEIVSSILNSFGIDCRYDKIRIKRVSLYKIVSEVCGKFNVKTPKIVLANTIISNAGVSGPIIRSALLIVTSGLLYKLNDDELKAVLGHELSHCIRRDPLALFILSNIEYISRIYILLSLVIFPLDILYFFFALTILFFVAKFFEARADLDSHMIFDSGDPLINALLKIAFPSVFIERYKAYRIRSWLRWNPHPPTYFRVLRLGSIESSKNIKNPLLKSIKDCVKGFISDI
ncbi:MAG: M56 family metallopeptidase [Candidatus Methanomethylicia archaeon]